MDNQNNKNKNNKNNKQGLSFIILVTLITTILVLALYQFQGMTGDKEVSYDEFLKMVEKGKVEKVVIQNDKIVITQKKAKGDNRPAKQYYTGVVKDDTLSDKLYEAGVKYEQEIPDTTSAVVDVYKRQPLMRAVVLLYIVKEGYMLIMGGLMMKKGRHMDGAQWYGKVCTAYTYVMIFLLLLIPGLPAMATKAMIGLCCLIMLFTLASYVLFYGRMRKEAGEEESH